MKSSLLFAGLLLSLVGARPALGQTVSGVVVDADGEPVVGAMVSVLGSDGESTLMSVLTGVDGSFVVDRPLPLTFRIRADRIGLQSTETDWLTPSNEGPLEVLISLSVQPLSLEGIDVEGDRRCRVRPEEGLAVSRVWDEARKALAAARWTQDRALYRFTLRRGARTLEADGRSVRSEDWSVSSGYVRRPYVSRPAEELLTEGFARFTSETSYFWAPDAEVLLSDAFLDTHCFRLGSPGPESAGLIGLEFEPVARRGVAEVSGTLWIDIGSSRLERLEYRYVHLDLPTELDTPLVGGWVDFTELDNGTWVVTGWRIRMPLAGASADPLTGARRIHLEAYREEGGDVLRVVGQGGAPVLVAEGAAIHGVVRDSTGVSGLAGARVSVEGTSVSTTSGSDGSFRLGGLDAGEYEVRVSHPFMDALQYAPESKRVRVEHRGSAEVDFAAPSRAAILAEACEGRLLGGQRTLKPGRGVHPTDGILFGKVLDEAGEPVGGALVRVLWREWRVTFGTDDGSPRPDVDEGRLGVTVSSSEAGDYLACGVPRGVPLEVIAVESLGEVDPGPQPPFVIPQDLREHRRFLFRIDPEHPASQRDVALASSLTGVIAGQVVAAESGEPLSGVPVVLLSTGRYEHTDEEGRFRFPYVPAGLHHLRADVEGGGAAEDSVAVGAGDSARVSLAPPGRLFQLDGVTAEVRSAEAQARLASGHPTLHISRTEMEELGRATIDLLGVLRTRAGPRLIISPVSRNGPVTGYCLGSTRAGVSSQATALERVTRSCKRVLVVLDGAAFNSPIEVPGAGLQPSDEAVSQLLGLSPTEIEDVTLLSPMQGRFEWGEEGRNGVLLIRARRGGS